jgi:hypothetical protein
MARAAAPGYSWLVKYANAKDPKKKAAEKAEKAEKAEANGGGGIDHQLLADMSIIIDNIYL